MSDTDIMNVVEDFGKENSKLRLLVCSDVASEGINLHHLSHKMVHFDVPWSLMVFQQRNGRIDRYGQKYQPEIRYLLTQSDNPRISGDTRVLEVLIDKDEQAQKNIGDTSEFTRAYSQEEEEAQIADQMMSDDISFDPANWIDNFYSENSALEEDDLFAGFANEVTHTENSDEVAEVASLFKDDLDYCENALKYLNQQGQKLKYEADTKGVISLYAPKDLRQRFKFLPTEIQPKEENNYTLHLSNKLDVINQEIIRCRSEQTAWPKIQYLWPINPVLQWLGDKMMGAFGRHQAPLLRVPALFESYEDHFVLSGLFPNRKSHPVVNSWLVVSFDDGELIGIEHFEDFIQRYPFHQHTLSNKGGERNHERQEALLSLAIDTVRPHLLHLRNEKDAELNQKLSEQMAKLDKLRDKQIKQLELDFDDSKQAEKIVNDKKAQRQREIDQIFDEYLRWIEDTMTTETSPYIQLVAVLTGSEGL